MAAKPPLNRLKSYTPGAIVSAPPGERKHILRRFWFPAVILLALAAGGLTGIIAAYQLNYSQAANEVAVLANHRPSIVTRIYADDGKTVIGEFALEKRIPLKRSLEKNPPCALAASSGCSSPRSVASWPVSLRLARVDLGRRHHLDVNVQVADAGSTQPGHALAAHGDHRA